MTARDKVGSVRRQIAPAGQGDIGVLSLFIAEAFFSLAVCQWLIPDGPTRRAVLPGYFRLYIEHAITDGLVQTTRDRAAAALWIPRRRPGSTTRRLHRAAGRPHRPAPG